ncbi:MAG TPA: EAL domain-containing protein, partial [Patescibacteria group bacterium]|nr:EAL domain-containing protein [Patescibacteria group bacterium]
LVLVKSIVTLAKNLQMKLIAEGVETAAEAKIVRELGVEWVQGFFFSKPLPEEDAVKFLQNWQPPVF